MVESEHYQVTYITVEGRTVVWTGEATSEEAAWQQAVDDSYTKEESKKWWNRTESVTKL